MRKLLTLKFEFIIILMAKGRGVHIVVSKGGDRG
jgi:hypothetical protein